MLDKYDFRVPFKEEFVISPKEGVSGWVDLKQFDLPNLSGKISQNNKGDYEVTDLNHNFESLPSSFTPMAFKVYKGSESSYPHVRLKASPAKLMQGHNVFGSDNPEHGMELLYLLVATYPKLADALDFRFTEIMNIDCTYSGVLPSLDIGLPVMEYLKNINHKQLKFSQGFDSSVYYNKGSEHGWLKLYLKYQEFLNQIREFKKNNSNGSYQHIIEIMTEERLMSYAKPLLRFEATITNRKLKEVGVPTLFFEFLKHAKKLDKENRNIIQELFLTKANPLFDALRGGNVNIYNDEDVRDALKAKHGKMNKNGKLNYDAALSAFRTYRGIVEYGYLETKNEMVARTFNRHVKLLIEAGVSKASLQNLQKGRATSNIVPILNIINIDFENQFPVWYQEPTSQFSNDVISISRASNYGQKLRLAS